MKQNSAEKIEKIRNENWHDYRAYLADFPESDEAKEGYGPMEFDDWFASEFGCTPEYFNVED